jgi:heme A synthase
MVNRTHRLLTLFLILAFLVTLYTFVVKETKLKKLREKMISNKTIMIILNIFIIKSIKTIIA